MSLQDLPFDLIESIDVLAGGPYLWTSLYGEKSVVFDVGIVRMDWASFRRLLLREESCAPCCGHNEKDNWLKDPLGYETFRRFASTDINWYSRRIRMHRRRWRNMRGMKRVKDRFGLRTPLPSKGMTLATEQAKMIDELEILRWKDRHASSLQNAQ